MFEVSRDFPRETIFGSSLPPIVCGTGWEGGFMSYLHYFCLFAHSSVQDILGNVFVFNFFVMLAFSMDSPFFIATSVFSNV